MVNLYKSGGTLGYLSALVGDDADSLAEVVERFELLSTIAEEDAHILAQIKGLKDRIVEQRRALQEERARVASVEADQAAVTNELQAADQECKASLNEVEAARAARKAVLTSIEKDQAAWARQEDQLWPTPTARGSSARRPSRPRRPRPGKGVLSWPVPGPVTSGFGYRIHPIFHVRRLHTGIDLRRRDGRLHQGRGGRHSHLCRLAGRLWQVHHHRPRRRAWLLSTRTSRRSWYRSGKWSSGGRSLARWGAPGILLARICISRSG